MDEQPEADEGYVMLVNAGEVNGEIRETDEDCIAAAKLANADGFIRMLPQGYQTALKGDGSDLSRGQRQLIRQKGTYYQLYTGAFELE